MSRVITIATPIRDGEALRAACHRLGLAEPVLGTHPLITEVASGFAVRLPGWKYPAVFQLDTSEVKFYSPGGGLDEQAELDRLFQAYEEMAAIEARREGHGARTFAARAWTFYGLGAASPDMSTLVQIAQISRMTSLSACDVQKLEVTMKSNGIKVMKDL